MNILTIAGFFIPLLQVYLLFRIMREVQIMANETSAKKELANDIKKFAAMFAEAGLADVPKPPRKKVSFEAEA